MIFQLALRNIKRSFGVYRVYLTSLIFATAIYFIFSNLKYNRQLLNNLDNANYIQLGFNMSAVVLFFVMAIFIFFSSNYFLRERKKEIGTYFLLGMRRYQVRATLFIETFTMSLIALCSGLLCGVFFSKLATMILFKFVGFDKASGFSFSYPALIETVVVFTSLIFLTAVTGMYRVKHFPIINLIQPKEKKYKPYLTVFFSTIGLVLILFGYSIACLFDAEGEKILNISLFLWIPLVTLLVCVGTYFVIQSLFPLLLTVLATLKIYVYRGTNMIWIEQLRSRMHSQVVMITTITILSAVTMTAFCIVNSLFYKTTIDVRNNPMINYQLLNGNPKMYDEALAKVDQRKLDFKIHTSFLTGDIEVPKMVNNPYNIRVIPWEDYHKIARKFNFRPSEKILGNESIFLYSKNNEGINFSANQKSVVYKIGNEKVHLKTTEIREKENVFSPYNSILVVSNQLYYELSQKTKATPVYYINLKPFTDSRELVTQMNEVVSHYHGASVISIEEDKNWSKLTFGMILYIGLFLSLVFIVTTGTIIYFKQIIDATKDIQTYKILYKMGVSYEEMRMIVAKQLGFIFIVPLFIAMSHCLFALFAYFKLLGFQFDISIVFSLSIYAVIYLCYYVMAVYHYLKIVCPPEMRTNI